MSMIAPPDTTVCLTDPASVALKVEAEDAVVRAAGWRTTAAAGT